MARRASPSSDGEGWGSPSSSGDRINGGDRFRGGGGGANVVELGVASRLIHPSDRRSDTDLPLASGQLSASNIRTVHSTQLSQQYQSSPTLHQQPQHQQLDLQYCFHNSDRNNGFDNFPPLDDYSSRIGNSNGETQFRYRMNSDEYGNDYIQNSKRPPAVEPFAR